jgi:hypothetical protein
MKLVTLILCLIISSSAFSHPPDSVSREERKEERKKARIERQRHRIMHQWDERTMQQKRTDRNILIVLAVASAILVNNVAHKE